MPALPAFPAFPNQDLWETSLQISGWAAMYLATARSKSKGNTTYPSSFPPALDLQHLDCVKGLSTMNCGCGNACVLQDNQGIFPSPPPPPCLRFHADPGTFGLYAITIINLAISLAIQLNPRKRGFDSDICLLVFQRRLCP